MRLLELIDWRSPTLRELRRPVPHWHPEFPLIVLWSPKAGSTVVANWFFYQIGLLDEAWEHNKFTHKFEHQVFKAHPDYLSNCRAAILAGRPTVKFVRDPAARAFSGFLTTCRPHALRNTQHWGGEARRLIQSSMNIRASVPQEHPISFADFVDWLAKVDHAKINRHFRCQFKPYETRLDPQIVPIEELSSRLSELEQRYGLMPHQKAPDRIFRSHHHNQKSIDLDGVKLEEFLHRALPVHHSSEIELPFVDTRRLAGTRLGSLLRQIFCADYDAYKVYDQPKPIVD